MNLEALFLYTYRKKKLGGQAPHVTVRLSIDSFGTGRTYELPGVAHFSLFFSWVTFNRVSSECVTKKKKISVRRVIIKKGEEQKSGFDRIKVFCFIKNRPLSNDVILIVCNFLHEL